MKVKNLSKILKGYRSGWVSISTNSTKQNKVQASAKTLSELEKKLIKQGNPEGVIMKAAQDFTNYVGTGKTSK